MREQILEQLEEIEDHYGVTILYACEAGSRCWGIDSEDSDYDVRFIYAHDHEWYMHLKEGRDVIESPIGNLDISGWDIRKALRLFKKSNPSFLEWLDSETVYIEDEIFVRGLLDLLPAYYNPTAAAYHYYHMAKGNYRDYLQGETVWIKKYFYVLRPLLCVLWIEATDKTLPPIEFRELVLSLPLAESLRDAIWILLDEKRSGKELGRGLRIPVLGDFIETELAKLGSKRFKGKPATKEWAGLDKLFIDTVYKHPLAQRLGIDFKE